MTKKPTITCNLWIAILYYTESFLGDYWMQLYLAKAKREAPVNKFVIQRINE